MNSISLCSNLPLRSYPIRAKSNLPHVRTLSVNCIRANDSKRVSTVNQQQQQASLSVLRFTLGIPGLDESYLPRWIGCAFGSLLMLNHFLGSDVATSAQLRTEALGLSLAGFSTVLPYLGQFLKGASPVGQAIAPVRADQIFAMSQDITDNLKDDLAWGTYVLLRNTNSISVLILIEDALCVRGYWITPEDLSKDEALDWFKMQVQLVGLSNIKDALYFPQSEDSEMWNMLPNGACSLLVQPMEGAKGFLLLASNINYAYTDKDRAWIGAIANKF